MKNLRTHGKKKIQGAFIIAAVAVIVLFTACQQFLDNPEEFLSYWASEAFIKDHNISSAHRPDGAGVPCVGSSAPVDIMLTVHNPKNFPLVMPTSSTPADIVEFKELSEQPKVGIHYELKRTGSGALKLTYKPSLLQKYEQGSVALNPTITLKAKDGRVFKQTYTFGIKSNTPPPKPKKIVIAKTKGSDPHYVLCLKFDSNEMTMVHKDINNITIKKGLSNNGLSNNGSSYKLSYKGDDSDFQKPAGDSFITHGSVAKLTEDIPSASEEWVLYFDTNLKVNDGNDQTLYTITLSDLKGVTSDKAVATIEANGPTHTVTFSVVGGHGKIQANSDAPTTNSSVSVANNGSVTFTAHPDTGWAVDSWTLDGSVVSGQTGTTYTLSNVTGNKNVTVKFKKKTYTVNYSVAGGHGKIQAGSDAPTTNSSVSVANNGSVTFTATPDNGWEVDSWSSNVAVDSSDNKKATLSNVTETTNKTVTVKFKPGELHFNSGGPNAWKRLKEEVEKTEGAHTITISGEITATTDQDNNGKISIRRELIIKSSGSSASLNANNLSGIFDVNNKLTLENITLKNGREPGNRTGAGAYVNSTLIMKGSSAITNCSAHKGGGVYVNNGTLIMQDSSTISSCTATDKGSGVYVAGTFEMKGNARVNTNNDVYLESGKSITVTGSLSHHPAARITPNSYTNGRVLATGPAEKANFKVTPQDGNKYWRFKKQGGEVKFVPAKLKVTFNKIKCVEVEDASSEAEYYWTMKVGKYVIAERPSNSVWDAKKGHIYEFIENGEYNKYFNWDFSYFPISEIPDINTTPKNYIPVYINIMEYDKSDPDDHIGTTKAHLTYDYDNDQWKWEYDGSQSHGNQESNPHITIGDGGEEIFTEEYRTNDGDTDVTITISWKE